MVRSAAKLRVSNHASFENAGTQVGCSRLASLLCRSRVNPKIGCPLLRMRGVRDPQSMQRAHLSRQAGRRTSLTQRTRHRSRRGGEHDEFSLNPSYGLNVVSFNPPPRSGGGGPPEGAVEGVKGILAEYVALIRPTCYVLTSPREIGVMRPTSSCAGVTCASMRALRSCGGSAWTAGSGPAVTRQVTTVLETAGSKRLPRRGPLRQKG